MKPLVDRLRDPTYLTPWQLRNEAADVIEKLDAENARLREALIKSQEGAKC
jgi:hypothetical protein